MRRAHDPSGFRGRGPRLRRHPQQQRIVILRDDNVRKFIQRVVDRYGLPLDAIDGQARQPQAEDTTTVL